LLTKSFAQAPEIQYSQPYFNFYDIENGLPSNEVYDLELDDADGSIWICTDNGISRFDGQSFKIYNSEDFSLVVLGIEKDSRSNLWFWTISGEVLKLNRTTDKIEKVFNINNFLGADFEVITEFEIDSNQVWISSSGERILFSIDSIGKAKLLSIEKRLPGVINIKEYATDGCGVSVIMGKNTMPNGHFQIWRNDELSFIEQNLELNNTPFNVYRSVKMEDKIYVQRSKSLIKISLNNQKLKYVENNFEHTPSIEKVGDSVIWVGAVDEGAFAFDTSLNLKQNLLKGYSVSSIHQDLDDKLWFGTLHHGLAHQLHSKLHYYPDLSLTEIKKTTLNIGDNSMLFAKDSTVFILEKIEGQFLIKTFATVGFQIESIWFEENQLVLKGYFKKGASRKVLKVKTFFKTPTYSNYNTSNYRKVKSKDGILYQKVKADNTWMQVGKAFGRIRTYVDLGDTAGLYFGGFRRTYYLEPITQQVKPIQFKGEIDLRTVLGIKDDTVLLGTKGNGLLLAKNGKVLQQLITDNTKLNIVLGMFKRNNKIWYTTPSGLFEIQGDLNDQIRCKNWTQFLGIHGLELHFAKKWGKEIVLSCSKGLFIFNPDSISQIDTPLRISSFEVKNQNEIQSIEAPSNNRVEVNYDAWPMTLTPKFVHFSGKVGLKFRYKIPSVDSLWNYTNTLPIIIFSLPSGQHEVIVQVQNRFGQWGINHSVLKISVIPPFWKTWWFGAELILLILVITSLWIRQHARRLKTKAKLEMEILESRNKALSIQLNPHFVFNSLNSVISYIANHDVKNALRFLGKFAKMMRNIFENSQYKFITLEEEIEAVKRYLDLESVRLDHVFEYSIEVNNEIIVSKTLIPPLVLQPLVENAIWHGVVQRDDDKGKIMLSISNINSERVRIRLSDNGPGLKTESGSSRVQKKRVSSVVLIRQRFHLLNKIYNNKFKLSHNATNNGYGVEMEIPLLIGEKH
jgi:hypothetical protein